ncbi:MAG TPA: HD domain-containing protein [Termitinemataceae bacterium]|nr:HD domain-containing protein [Termitinemataceae bacterium]HOM23949.1 HD domain-containing protein [Termitinemataceae bacterium]HPQ01028.1 HD domain-containing protein [Termitinemataceae bacterium]
MQRDVRALLDQGYGEPIRCNVWGHIYLSPSLGELYRSRPFQRLQRIKQLGPTFLVYPGATHTRAAHSLGVYHLARRLIRALVDRGADGWVSPTGLMSFLCAALLHDLGHFPYTHSLKELPLSRHEELSATIILQDEIKHLVGRTGADPYMTAAIIDDELPCQENREVLFYRKLLSGVLDPDKLDYLTRDAHSCGVPYGIQDVDFIIHHLWPHPQHGLMIDERGISSVEALLFSKYLMYRAVYWQRDVRSATAMIKKAIFLALKEGLLQKEALYNLDDQGLIALGKKLPAPVSSLVTMVEEGKLYPQIAEYPPEPTYLATLSGLEQREFQEESLRQKLQERSGIPFAKGELIIDIPEEISFETNLFIREDSREFPERSTVFSREVIQSFTASIRHIRVFVHPDRFSAIQGSPKLRDVLQNPLDWLHLS